MTIDSSSFEALLAAARDIVLISHFNPDGDAVGSVTAAYHYLKSRGKEPHIILPSPYPESMAFLEPEEAEGRMTICEQDSEKARRLVRGTDLIICLDLNRLSRTEYLEQDILSARAKRILIDHHIPAELERFDLAISTTEVSSTCELLYWILRSLPCPSAEVLKAKFRTQFLLNIVPAAVCCVVAMTVLGIGPLTQILAVLLLASAEWLSAGFCLSMNLCFPYLNWTTDAFAVKQGTSVLICTFAGMGMGLLLAGILAVFGIFLDVRIGMAVGTVLCSVPAALIQLWVGRRGVRRWEEI